MSKVSVKKELSIKFEQEELDILEKAYEIVKSTKHDLFVADDESDEFWVADSAADSLKELIGFGGRFVK